MDAWTYGFLGLPGMIAAGVSSAGQYLLGAPDAGDWGASAGENVRDAIDTGESLIDNATDVIQAPVETVTETANELGDNAEQIAKSLERMIMVGGALVVGTTVLVGGALLAGTVAYMTGRAEPLVQFARGVR